MSIQEEAAGTAFYGSVWLLWAIFKNLSQIIIVQGTMVIWDRNFELGIIWKHFSNETKGQSLLTPDFNLGVDDYYAAVPPITIPVWPCPHQIFCWHFSNPQISYFVSPHLKPSTDSLTSMSNIKIGSNFLPSRTFSYPELSPELFPIPNFPL